MEEQYEKEREAERRSEHKCIQTIDIINKKIDKLQLTCKQTNLFISQTNRKIRKSKRNILFFGFLSGIACLFYYTKCRPEWVIKIYDDKTAKAVKI